MIDRGLRVLHAIHDFLPRHQAGSEIYAAALCRELMRRHHVVEGRFMIHVRHRQHPWIVIVEPDADANLLVVVTVYEVSE